MRYSDIYEEMEVFNDEFYVEPLPDEGSLMTPWIF